LGNDFILFDERDRQDVRMAEKLQSVQWKAYVEKLCDRHRGIGADGVLILMKNNTQIAEMLIFNSDGSQSQICLNGIRCCAHHIYLQNADDKRIAIKAGKQIVENEIVSGDNSLRIMTRISSPTYERSLSIETTDRILNGHCVDVGNPHFVVFEKNELSWLTRNGGQIESHTAFPQKTNVEFVWPEMGGEPLTYHILVYERGCGITLSCSSGAAAITKAMHHLGMIQAEQRVNLLMLGGLIECRMSSNGQVSLLGCAERIFCGEMANHDGIETIL